MVWVCFVGRMGVREMDMVHTILDKMPRQMLLLVNRIGNWRETTMPSSWLMYPAALLVCGIVSSH